MGDVWSWFVAWLTEEAARIIWEQQHCEPVVKR
jgi:hypothetical protein